MPLDPEAQTLLQQMDALGFPPIYMMSPEEARSFFKARPRAAGPEVATAHNKSVPGPGFEIPVRIYTPTGTGPFPILMWFHAGGWVHGDLDSADATARHLCVGGGCVVVSVDYRRAPETKFPGAANDACVATQWVVQHAALLNGDAHRIAVGGDSAGGNLAAVVSLMARDSGGLGLVFQLLVYPVTHCDLTTASWHQYAEGFSLTRKTMEWYWNHYLPTPAEGHNPHASPLLAADVTGLPPALVITAECDPLCDEGAAYAKRLQEAGVPTTYSCYAGMIHGFFTLPAVLHKGGLALAEAAAALQRAFAARPVSTP